MGADTRAKVEILEEADVLDPASLTSQEVQRLNSHLTDSEVETLVKLRRKLGDRFRLLCTAHRPVF